MSGDDLPDPDQLLDEQVEYYRARAPEYDQWWLRTGRYDIDDEFGRRWEGEKAVLARAVADFDASGDVLELAAGTGNLTVRIASTAASVTAVDASGEALAIAAEKLEGAGLAEKVTFVDADLFSWRPPRRFDAVAFGFWLSHVPVGHAARFWDLVDAALVPGGRVLFIDNAVPVEQAAASGGRRAVTPWSRTWVDRGVSVRELADGRRFSIVKRAWTPAELEAELARHGWDATVATTGSFFIHGTAVRRRASVGSD